MAALPLPYSGARSTGVRQVARDSFVAVGGCRVAASQRAGVGMRAGSVHARIALALLRGSRTSEAAEGTGGESQRAEAEELVVALDQPQITKACKHLPPPARKRRYDGEGSVQFEVAPCLCLMGKYLKDPVCLTTKEFDGVMFLRLGAKEAWLHMVLSGRVRSTDLPGAIISVTNSLKSMISTQTALIEQSREEEGRRATEAGRKALGLDDDSSDSDHDAPAASRRKQRRQRRDIPRKVRMFSVTVQGITMKALTVKRTLWVECSVACVDAVCAEVTDHLVPRALREARKTKVARPTDKQMLADCEGRVRFVAEMNSLLVMYRHDDGSNRKKELTIPIRKPFGVMMSPEEYAATMREQIVEAKKHWNILDKSDRPRFPI